MISFNDPARQAAISLSERLGSLAAQSPAIRPESAFTQLDPAHPAISPRLTSILGHFRQRARIQEHAADKLRANEFMAGS